MAEARGKTDSFLKAINKYADEQQNKIQTEIEKYKKRELEKAESEILTEVYDLIQNEISEVRGSIARESSLKEMELRKKLLNQRREIIDDVFKKVEDKLFEFVKTDDYIKVIKKFADEVASILNEDGTTIYVNERDLHLKDEILSFFTCKCNVLPSKDILIGGIYALNEKLGIVADNTLSSKLEEQRDWFAENCGLTIV